MVNKALYNMYFYYTQNLNANPQKNIQIDFQGF